MFGNFVDFGYYGCFFVFVVVFVGYVDDVVGIYKVVG